MDLNGGHLDPNTLTRPPYLYTWRQPERPLPRREVRPVGKPRPLPFGSEPPPWLDTGPTDQPFDFTGRIAELTADVCRHCADFVHIDPAHILFAFTQARGDRPRGLQARVTPLRFAGGDLLKRFRGRLFQVQRYRVDGREMLYLLAFCLPRYLNQSFDEKFVTLFHELYHINGEFNGDLRRHGGRYSLHTSSQHDYDRAMAALARNYLNAGASPKLYGFLRLNFDQLVHRHGSVVGVRVPRPKVVPLPE